MEEINNDVTEKIRLMRTRDLDDTYTIIYVIKNKIKYNTKDKLVSKYLYSFMGINNLGFRTILDMKIERENDNHFWLDIFESFKARGVKKILFLSIESDNKISRALKISYPDTIITLSLTNIIQSIYKFVDCRGRNVLIKQIKNLCIQESLDEFYDKVKVFKEQYKNNYIMATIVDNNIANFKSYYKYSVNIRKFLFNHNRISDLYDMINKYSKSNYINHINELWDYLYNDIVYIEEYKSYSKKNWTGVLNDLYLLFPNYLEYLIKE